MAHATNSFSAIVHIAMDLIATTLEEAEERRRELETELPASSMVAKVASAIVIGTSAITLVFYMYQIFMNRYVGLFFKSCIITV